MVKRREREFKENRTQTEVPNIHINNDIIEVSGYQEFKISKDNIFGEKRKLNGKKQTIVTNVIKNNNDCCKTLIDFGCSQGYYSYFAYFNGYKVNAFDHDPTYVDYLNKIKSHLGFDSSIEFYNAKFGEAGAELNADICLFLALIHHIYKATDSFGSIKTIIDKLYHMVNKILIIEWIPKQYDYQKSENYNDTTITESYTTENFENALKIFSKIDIHNTKKGKNPGGRKIYVCYK
jgi:2-polyprenyl-3-methyl-5-hydroxy-6-metoxy-1,4-benzoquinol methylase